MPLMNTTQVLANVHMCIKQTETDNLPLLLPQKFKTQIHKKYKMKQIQNQDASNEYRLCTVQSTKCKNAKTPPVQWEAVVCLVSDSDWIKIKFFITFMENKEADKPNQRRWIGHLPTRVTFQVCPID